MPTALYFMAACGALVVLSFLAMVMVAAGSVVIGKRYEKAVMSRLPWDRWMTLDEVAQEAGHSKFVCSHVLSLQEEDIEAETLPGAPDYVLKVIEKYGIEFWTLPYQRIRLVKGGRPRKRKPATPEKARLAWRPRFA